MKERLLATWEAAKAYAPGKGLEGISTSTLGINAPILPAEDPVVRVMQAARRFRSCIRGSVVRPHPTELE